MFWVRVDSQYCRMVHRLFPAAEYRGSANHGSKLWVHRCFHHEMGSFLLAQSSCLECVHVRSCFHRLGDLSQNSQSHPLDLARLRRNLCHRSHRCAMSPHQWLDRKHNLETSDLLELGPSFAAFSFPASDTSWSRGCVCSSASTSACNLGGNRTSQAPLVYLLRT